MQDGRPWTDHRRSLDGPLALITAIPATPHRSSTSNRPWRARLTSWPCPTWKAATCRAKKLEYLAGASSAGIVLGARVPIALTSRADPLRSRVGWPSYWPCWWPTMRTATTPAKPGAMAGKVRHGHPGCQRRFEHACLPCTAFGRAPGTALYSAALSRVWSRTDAPRWSGAKARVHTRRSASARSGRALHLSPARVGERLAAGLLRAGTLLPWPIAWCTVARATRPASSSRQALSGPDGAGALAPLHQPHNLAGIRAFQQAFPTAAQVACF